MTNFHGGKNLKLSLYRKPTNRGDFIQYFFAHDACTRSGTVIGFYLRALRICDIEFLNDELNYIGRVPGKGQGNSSKTEVERLDIVLHRPRSIPNPKSVVYSIPCLNFDLHFIGEWVIPGQRDTLFSKSAPSHHGFFFNFA